MVGRIDAYPKPTVCPYCSSNVIYTSNAVIYGREYGNGRCYKCTSCDAYVGVHDGTDIPLGRLANRKLRLLKQKCHVFFDQTWQKRKIKRQQAYRMLADRLGIPRQECHFGWFDEPMLKRAMKVLETPDWYEDSSENTRCSICQTKVEGGYCGCYRHPNLLGGNQP